MKIAHLSDLHLGYGTGRRAQDVLRAFETAMAQVSELELDLVVVSGDVFDHPGVAAAPIAVFAKAVERLRSRLPGVVVAAAAGVRDTPLDPKLLGPLALVGEIASVEVACTTVRRLRIRDRNAQVVLVPHRAVTAAPLDVSPDPEARWNVLVVYAGMAPAGVRAPAVPLTGWDYVALGSNHTHTQVAERARYAGSLERIGANPWEEASDEKGFVTFDTESGEAKFWPVGARAVISLAPVDATGGDTATATRRLAEALAGVPGKIDGKLLRVPVSGLAPDDFAALDRESLAPVRQRAAELRVLAPTERSSPQRGATADNDDDAPFKLVSLEGGRGGPTCDLSDAKGLVAFLADGAPEWDEYISALRGADAFKEALRADGMGVLHQEEWAAVWYGDGAVATWLSAAGALAAGPDQSVGEPDDPSATDAGSPDARLRSLREEEAEVRGDLEAGMVAWVRERQDAETRLLLYRDRGRELQARLKQVDQAGSEGSCGSCGAPLGDRLETVRQAGKEEWEGVVQDGRWWRRRLDQLERKPSDLKALELRALALSAAAAELAEQQERRIAGRRVRARIHAEAVEITGGRLAGVFPALFAEWTEGGGRGGGQLSALALATRIATAEFALEAGVKLGSVILPDSLDRLHDEDVPRALDRLARLARRIPLVLVNAPERLAAATPERFDLLYRLKGAPGRRRVDRQRPGLGTVRLKS